jgi:hypothetical protein
MYAATHMKAREPMDIMLHAHLPFEKYKGGRYTLMQAAELLCAGKAPGRIMWDPRCPYIVQAMTHLHNATTWQEGRRDALRELPKMMAMDWDKRRRRLNQARRMVGFGPI